MTPFHYLPKCPVNFAFDKAEEKCDLRAKCKLRVAIESGTFDVVDNVEPSIHRTFRGIVIDLREEQPQNAPDSMRVNSESVSNEIDESDSQDKKQNEQRI
jgi:hypothetical protein